MSGVLTVEDIKNNIRLLRRNESLDSWNNLMEITPDYRQNDIYVEMGTKTLVTPGMIPKYMPHAEDREKKFEQSMPPSIPTVGTVEIPKQVLRSFEDAVRKSRGNEVFALGVAKHLDGDKWEIVHVEPEIGMGASWGSAEGAPIKIVSLISILKKQDPSSHFLPVIYHSHPRGIKNASDTDFTLCDHFNYEHNKKEARQHNYDDIALHRANKDAVVARLHFMGDCIMGVHIPGEGPVNMYYKKRKVNFKRI